MKKIKVVFVTTSYPVSIETGPELYARNLLQLFSGSNMIDFTLVSETIVQAGSDLQTVERKARTGYYAALEQTVSRVMSRLSPDTILHCNSAHLLTQSFVGKHKTVLQINDTEVCDLRLTPMSITRLGPRRTAALLWRRRRERRATKVARLNIANSEYTGARIKEKYQLDSKSVRAIYKAIDLEPFERVARVRKEGFHADEIRAVLVGSNWYRKGVDTAIRAVRILRGRGINCQLSLYGKPSLRDEQRISSLIVAENLEGHVHCKGVVGRSQLPNVLAENDVFVMPSREEALGVSVIEAIATGMPAVVSDVGGLPEVVHSGLCGVCVSADSVSELANAIAGLSKLASRCTPLQRSREMNRFSLPQLGDKLEALYFSLS